MNYTDFWKKRTNIKNRPSVSNRTDFVIAYIMRRDGLSMGVVLEKLIESPTMWSETIKELAAQNKGIDY